MKQITFLLPLVAMVLAFQNCGPINLKSGPDILSGKVAYEGPEGVAPEVSPQRDPTQPPTERVIQLLPQRSYRVISMDETANFKCPDNADCMAPAVRATQLDRSLELEFIGLNRFLLKSDCTSIIGTINIVGSTGRPETEVRILEYALPKAGRPAWCEKQESTIVARAIKAFMASTFVFQSSHYPTYSDDVKSAAAQIAPYDGYDPSVIFCTKDRNTTLRLVPSYPLNYTQAVID